MFELKEVTIDAFINDEKIMLPRYQRKKTWFDRKNFELCISLYKDFPLGVVVINMEEDEGKFEKWLLDGRQRRNALIMMKNPEQIYKWAKAFIGFRTGDTHQDIHDKFWKSIDEFLGDDEYNEPNEEKPTNNKEEYEESDILTLDEISPEDIESEDQDSADDDIDISTDINTDPIIPSLSFKRGDLTRLLQVIQMVHPIRGKTSGLTKPFNFSKYIKGLDYVLTGDDGEEYVSPAELLAWIEYKKELSQRKKQEYPPTQEIFFEWIKFKNYLIKSETTIKKEIERRWDSIINILNVLESLNLQIKEGKIGYIQLKGYKGDDAKKIFHIINSGGTKLDMAEILSAKPSWNQPVKNPSKAILDNVKQLYKRLEINQPDDVVRWDIAATLLARINMEFIIDSSETLTGKDDLTLGFKLLSGYYIGGVRKDDIEALPKSKAIKSWNAMDFENKVNQVKNELLKSDTFKFWASWRASLISLSSQAIAINFILITIKDWERKGKPINMNSTEHKKFLRNAKILLDQLIYEYLTNQWRGPGDSKIGLNLKNLDERGDVFHPIAQEKWDALISEMVNDGKINGVIYSSSNSVDKKVKLLLLYYYTLAEISGPEISVVKDYDFDHIIPRTTIDSSSSDYGKNHKSNIFNICALPRRENISKGDRALDSIDEPWLTQQIEKYAEIPFEKFGDFSRAISMEDLHRFRGEKFISTFKDKRAMLE